MWLTVPYSLNRLPNIKSERTSLLFCADLAFFARKKNCCSAKPLTLKSQVAPVEPASELANIGPNPSAPIGLCRRTASRASVTLIFARSWYTRIIKWNSYRITFRNNERYSNSCLFLARCWNTNSNLVTTREDSGPGGVHIPAKSKSDRCIFSNYQTTCLLNLIILSCGA